MNSFRLIRAYEWTLFAVLVALTALIVVVYAVSPHQGDPCAVQACWDCRAIGECAP